MTTTNILPALTAANTDAEILALLKNPEAAIGFAIEHIEDFEVLPFLIDWRNDADMTPWVEAWRTDVEVGGGISRTVKRSAE